MDSPRESLPNQTESSNPHPFDLIKGDFIGAPVVKLGGAGAGPFPWCSDNERTSSLSEMNSAEAECLLLGIPEQRQVDPSNFISLADLTQLNEEELNDQFLRLYGIEPASCSRRTPFRLRSRGRRSWCGPDGSRCTSGSRPAASR
jgi:hypothetical protein